MNHKSVRTSPLRHLHTSLPMVRPGTSAPKKGAKGGRGRGQDLVPIKSLVTKAIRVRNVTTTMKTNMGSCADALEERVAAAARRLTRLTNERVTLQSAIKRMRKTSGKEVRAALSLAREALSNAAQTSQIITTRTDDMTAALRSMHNNAVLAEDACYYAQAIASGLMDSDRGAGGLNTFASVFRPACEDAHPEQEPSCWLHARRCMEHRLVSNT